MKVTLSIIKADIGWIGGHIAPSKRLLDTREQVTSTAPTRALRRVRSTRARSEPLECFGHPFWNSVRDRAAQKGMEMRKQGFFDAAMLPMGELEYTCIVETLDRLQPNFYLRADNRAAA